MRVMDGIKQAVLAQDWNMICKIYTFVTKEPLEPPKIKTDSEILSEIELPDNIITFPNPGGDILTAANTKFDPIEISIPTPKKKGRPKKVIELPTAPTERDSDGPPIRVDEEDIDESPVVRRQKRVRQKFGDQGNQARTEPLRIKGRKIKFFGEGANADSHKNDPQLQKLYGGMKHNRTTRELVEDIDVICSVCGREETVSPIIGANYNEDPDENTYKCNKCCSGG